MTWEKEKRIAYHVFIRLFTTYSLTVLAAQEPPMNEEQKSGNLLIVTFGALIGLAAALFALALRRFRRSAPPLDQESLPQLPASQPASASYPTPAAPSTGILGAAPSAASGPRWSTPTKYIMGVVLFLGALLVLVVGRGVIPMVILAALLALFIDPFIHMLNRRLRLKWAGAVVLTYMLVILLLLMIPLLVIPSLLSAANYLIGLDYQQLASQAAQAISEFTASLQNSPLLNNWLAPMLNAVVQALENFTLGGQVQTAVTEVTLSSLSSQIVHQLGILVGIVSPIVTLVVTAIFTLIMALQMSLASNSISSWYPDLIPQAYKDEYSALIKDISRTWISFLRGQMSLMLIVGLAVALGGTILGVPYALLMGIIAGLLELIPNIGPTLAAIPAVLLSLMLGSTYLPIESNLVFALIVVALYVLIQTLENQFLVPYVMGDAVDLPPLIVLIGTVGGAMAFGILGALLATPVIATGSRVFQFIYRKILEPPPLPPEPEEKPSIWDSVKGWAGKIKLPGKKRAVTSDK
jgi:predicted PurR-regulated permease PerM